MCPRDIKHIVQIGTDKADHATEGQRIFTSLIRVASRIQIEDSGHPDERVESGPVHYVDVGECSHPCRHSGKAVCRKSDDFGCRSGKLNRVRSAAARNHPGVRSTTRQREPIVASSPVEVNRLGSIKAERINHGAADITVDIVDSQRTSATHIGIGRPIVERPA